MDEEGILEMTWMIFASSSVFSFLILVTLGKKWELDKKFILPAALVIGIFSGAIVNGISKFYNLSFYQIAVMEIILITTTAILLLLWRFYRDPDRIPPKIDNAILSPADGEILYIKKIEEGEIPFSDKNGKKFSLRDFVQADVLPNGGYLIGIAMNYLDVHVNRAPIGGKIVLLKRIKGLFISLKKKEAAFQNERVFTVIDNGDFKVGIIQIASRLVRKIVPYIKEGEQIKRGKRIGVIRFGSQVDLIIPNLLSIRIEVLSNTKVVAGLSVIATFDRTLGEDNKLTRTKS